MHAREHQMRGRRADVDADCGQLDIVRRPDRFADLARLGGVVDVDMLEFEIVHTLFVDGPPQRRRYAASPMNFAMPDLTPCLASSVKNILWMRGSWCWYSIWQPPSLTLTSMPMNTRFLSAVNG